MQAPCLNICKQQLGFLHTPNNLSTSSSSNPNDKLIFPFISCKFNSQNRNPKRDKSITAKNNNSSSNGGSVNGERVKVKGKGKENVWSIDNELAKAASAAAAEKERSNSKRRRRGRKVESVSKKKRGPTSRVLVSATMLMEVETVLQTQEPVIRPVWNTFASSVSGIWKGVGAAFSPITAEMEPIEMGKKNENLYDCYTLSLIEALPSSSRGQPSQIQRKINWVTLNPYGEIQNENKEGKHGVKETRDENVKKTELPKFESFDFLKSDVMEEDVMGMEPGLVFFEVSFAPILPGFLISCLSELLNRVPHLQDGSYSRGPVDIPVGEVDDSKYYLSPIFKFEQCLVKGCHKRLRIVHTIEFSNGGAEIQILRVAVYEEEWVSPAKIPDPSDLEFDLKPFSQRRRVQPSELTGFWKVFEVSATPIFGDEMAMEESGGTPYVYLCTETLKKRSLPESSVHFGEEEVLDMQDVAVLWLPGGITGYVDVNKDGNLCIGVGWYSDEGINLVMERDYGIDGKLKEVRWKSEVKRRWSD
ncbi:hypothetical protein RJ641_016300 [Dillenia turbinata]|uniref:Uncharacterized protein n=1 Tax=Dillenia turbinata TaxID=194707 RepID=A0AAN8UZ70_9MAGN